MPSIQRAAYALRGWWLRGPSLAYRKKEQKPGVARAEGPSPRPFRSRGGILVGEEVASAGSPMGRVVGRRDDQWERIEHLLLGKASDRGVTAVVVSRLSHP